jgi:ribosomal protein S27E
MTRKSPTCGCSPVGRSSTRLNLFDIYSSQFFSEYAYYNTFALTLSYCCSHKFTSCVAFNALRFQPSFTSHLLLAFADIVLIKRFPIEQAFPQMLGQSYKLGHHTDVFLLTTDVERDSLKVVKYSWAHIDHHPWGNFLPIQCPGCGWVNAWHSACHRRVYLFECKNDACTISYTFGPEEGMTMLVPGKGVGSCWIKIPVTALPGGSAT